MSNVNYPVYIICQLKAQHLGGWIMSVCVCVCVGRVCLHCYCREKLLPSLHRFHLFMTRCDFGIVLDGPNRCALVALSIGG